MNQNLVDALIRVIEALSPEEQQFLRSRLQESAPSRPSGNTKTVLDAELVDDNTERSAAVLQTNLPNRLPDD